MLQLALMEPQTIKSLLKTTIPYLASYSDTPQQDAVLLLCNLLKIARSHIYTYPEQSVTRQQQHEFEKKIQRRIKGEPIAYILEQQGFWTLNLKVTPAVLIPRPETELLIEIILEQFNHKKTLKIADLGTGSGAIALALAKERQEWQITATDYSAPALVIAKENAEQHQIKNITFLQGDWCDALPNEKFDVIVSNPPYIASNDPHLNRGNLLYEPKKALIAGADGLEAIAKIAGQVKNYLLPNGILLLEHGFTQATAVKNILQKSGYCQILCRRDLNNHERVTQAALR